MFCQIDEALVKAGIWEVGLQGEGGSLVDERGGEALLRAAARFGASASPAAHAAATAGQ